MPGVRSRCLWRSGASGCERWRDAWPGARDAPVRSARLTLVCVPIFVETVAGALADARQARDAGADLVEFRLDSFFTGERVEAAPQADALAGLIAGSPLPCIATCRPVLEGGQYDGPDDARIALFERLSAAADRGAAPRYIDVELATYTRSESVRQKVNLGVEHPGQVRPVETGLILSLHDFHTRPADLFRRVEAMAKEPACRVMKVAYRARSVRDNLELLDVQAAGRETGKPTIALGMGPYGLLSRVLAPKFGGFLTFASLRRESGTAPGQPVLSDLLETYRFRQIGTATRVYGVVGDPVEHSLSPHVHNAGFEAVGHDGVYLPLPVPSGYEHFKATVLALLDHGELDLAGLSATIPHKESLVRLAREMAAEGDPRWTLDLLSQRCGAANTLSVKRDGRGRPTAFTVRNTDGPAGAGLIEGPGVVVVVGVGGTARAVAAELMHRGRRVVLVNRTHNRAVALADELNGGVAAGPVRASTWDRLEHDVDGGWAGVSALMNCTPLGMVGGPGADENPVPDVILGNLPKHARVSDAVYAPLATPLLREAASLGLACVDGLTMFIAQAADQFETWTGRGAPRSLFERVAKETLASRA